MTKRVELASELKRRFVERGLPISGVAKQLSLPENSLRTWLRRNTFPDKALPAIATFVGLSKSTENLRLHYSFEVSGEGHIRRRRVAALLQQQDLDLPQALEAVEHDLSERLPDPGDFVRELKVLFRSMGEGDLYVHASVDQFPIEMEGTGLSVLAKDAAGAIGRGAHFAYLVPDSETATRARAFGLHRALNPDRFDDAHQAFLGRITQCLPNLNEHALYQWIRPVPCDGPLFMTPGIQFLFFHSQRDTTLGPRLFLLLPVAREAQRSSFCLRVADEMCGPFVSYVTAVLERGQHTDLAKLLY